MENILETITINTKDGFVNIWHDRGIIFNSCYDERSLDVREKLENLFNSMSNNDIKHISRKKSEDEISILFKTQKGLIKTIISDYNTFKKKAYFKVLQDKIRKHNTDMLANKVSKKIDLQKAICAGSLISSMVLVTVVSNLSDETLQKISKNSIENPSVSHSQIIVETPKQIEKETFILNINDEPLSFKNNTSNPMEIEIPETNAEVIDNLDNSTTEENITLEESTVNNEVNDTLDIPSIDNKINNLINNIAQNQENKNDIKPIINQSTTNSYFSELKDFLEYEDYIKFAANLYGVDVETAKQVVTENWKTFDTPSENVSGDVTTEMNRMKDLKEKGIINGDLNIIGIFISIKDYAIDNLNLNNQTPIISNKTNEEQEQDLIDVAKYIYGIDNTDILNTIIAVHRIETNSGTNSIATEKNNLGGIINPNSDYENPYPNVYKTSEIGAESAIRNFLMVFDKCIYEPNNKQASSIPEFMCNTYCPHTPENWKAEVTSKLNEGIPEIVEGYLNNTTTKTY